MRKKFLFAICVFLILVPQILASTVYYIDGTNGNDNNNGLTLSTAWKTFNKANATLVAGDTVYIRAGTYDTYIAPNNSGTSGNFITYARYQSEAVTIDGPIYGADLRGKSYIKIDGLRIINCFYANMYSTSTTEHNIIQNCYFAYPANKGQNWAGIWMGYDSSPWGNCNYNQILNNEFHSDASGYPDDLVYLQPYSKYNLIQGNTFYSSSHNCIDLQAIQIQDGVMYNVIKDNYIINQYHTGLNIYAGSQRNLVEGNTIEDCNTTWYQSGIQIGGTKNIIRRNVLINNGTGILLEEDNAHGISGDYSRIYHNTFNKNRRGVHTTTAEGLTEATVKNNIFYNDVDYEIVWDVQGNPRDNYFITNNISGAAIKFYPPGDQTLSYLQTNYPSFWRGNIQLNPIFVDETNRDLNLQSSSPMIDAGAFLTKTRSSGSGTSIPVEDAQYFMNGWGIIEGDLIQLEGQIQTARITNVDYNNNILTVDTSLSWNSGQGVSLRYLGFAPDIGAHECVKPVFVRMNASPTSGQSPLIVNFSGNAIGDFPPFTYNWNFGDGQFSTIQNPSHTYSSQGNYTATLTVTDSKANKESISVTISVYNANQLSLFTATGAPAPGQGGTTNPSPGTHSYTQGSSVQLSAVNYQNYRFSLWSGDILSSEVYKETTTVIIDRNKSLTANFCTKCGDVNGDLNITPTDAQRAFDIFLGRIPNPTACEKENADVNCDGTKTVPRITPGDAQAIFEKYLGRSELSSNCSGNSRAAALSMKKLSLQNIQLIINDVRVGLGEEIVVPIIVNSPSDINSFGLDLSFPKEALEFIRLERAEISREFQQLDANEIMPGILRVGGYKSKSSTSRTSNNLFILIALVFKVGNQEKAKSVSSLSVVSTYDEFQNATIQNGMIHWKAEKNKKIIGKVNEKRNDA